MKINGLTKLQLIKENKITCWEWIVKHDFHNKNSHQITDDLAEEIYEIQKFMFIQGMNKRDIK